jgi:hypothetical protein
MSTEQSGKAGELPRINMNRVYDASWRAYRVNQVRASKAQHEAIYARDKAAYRQAGKQFRLSLDYQSQDSLSLAWCPMTPSDFYRFGP